MDLNTMKVCKCGHSWYHLLLVLNVESIFSPLESRLVFWLATMDSRMFCPDSPSRKNLTVQLWGSESLESLRCHSASVTESYITESHFLSRFPNFSARAKQENKGPVTEAHCRPHLHASLTAQLTTLAKIVKPALQMDFFRSPITCILFSFDRCLSPNIRYKYLTLQTP